MKQNPDNIRGNSISEIKLPRIIVNMSEFNLLHMPNLLDMNRIK